MFAKKFATKNRRQKPVSKIDPRLITRNFIWAEMVVKSTIWLQKICVNETKSITIYSFYNKIFVQKKLIFFD